MKSITITKKYSKSGKLLTGFTLIEVLITISIFVVLIFGITAILSGIFTNSSGQLLSMSNIDQARAVTTTFTNEIRNAITGSDGSYALNQAGDNQIIFYSNFKTPNLVVERIRYYVSGSTLYKGTVIPTGSPATYNLASESVKSIATGVANQGENVFYYYDGNYTGSSAALSQPVNINQVRYVKINLRLQNQITPSDNSTFSISAGATVRSVKDNLGN